MRHKIVTTVMYAIAIGMAVAFLAVPAVKLKDPAMIIVMLIGVGAMLWNFVEVFREKD